MAGKYYAATPIGEGMQNLATAIAGIPERELKAGLMKQQVELAKQRVLSEGITQAYHQAQTDKVQMEMRGRQMRADAYRGGTTGTGSPPADAPPVAPSTDTSVANAFGPVAPVGFSATGAPPPPPVSPLSVSADAEVSAPPAPPSGMAAAVAPDMLAPVVVKAAPPPPVVPAAPLPGGGTGVTRDMVANLAAGGALSGEDNKWGEGLLSYGGGNLAADSPDADTAMSWLGQGAKQPFSGTVRGGKATIQERADAAAQQSRDRRYNTDVDASTARRGQDLTDTRTRDLAQNRLDAGVGGSKASKGAKGPVWNAQQSRFASQELDKYVNATPNMKPPTGEQRQAILQSAQDKYLRGDITLQDAIMDATDEAVNPAETVTKPTWLGLSSEQVSQPATFKKDLKREPKGSAAPAAPAAPASAPAAKPKLDAKQVDSFAAQAKARGWTDAQIAARKRELGL